MRDARASVTSAMFVLANPIVAVTAKTKVIAHTASPQERWRAGGPARVGPRKTAPPARSNRQPRQWRGKAIRRYRSVQATAQTSVHGHADAGQRKRGRRQQERGDTRA